MNNARRKALDQIIADIKKFSESITELAETLEALKDEEEEYKETMPENMIGGEKYEKAEGAVSKMEEAKSELESIAFSLDEVVSSIEEAKE